MVSCQGHHFLYGAAVAVCIAIAVPSYCLGCHPVLQPYCFRFHKVDAVVRGMDLKERTCEGKCTEWHRSCPSCSKTCVSRESYWCFDSVAVVEYVQGASNHTCDVSVRTGSRSARAAEAAVEDEYPLGSSHVLFVDKNIGTCTTPGEAAVLALVGVVFFCIAGVVAFVWIMHDAHNRRRDQRRRHSSSRANLRATDIEACID